REHQSARDLLLLEELAAVERVVVEALGAAPGVQRREEHEHAEQEQDHEREASDLAVQRTSPPRSAPGSRRARSETIRSSASRKKLATIELPPYEMNGSVTPVSGMVCVTPPTITNTCSANTALRPAARSLPKPSVASIAVLNPRCTISRHTTRTAQAPNSPSSSV